MVFVKTLFLLGLLCFGEASIKTIFSIDKCLNKWCEFDNFETKIINLEFQIQYGDKLIVQKIGSYFDNIHVTLYPSDKTVWSLSQVFSSSMLTKSLYQTSEYYGSNERSCNWKKSKPTFCKNDDECTVLFELDPILGFFYPTINVNAATSYILNYFASIELGGMESNQHGQIMNTNKAKFKFVPNGDIKTRNAPLPSDSKFDAFVKTGRHDCIVFEEENKTTPPPLDQQSTTSPDPITDSPSTPEVITPPPITSTAIPSSSTSTSTTNISPFTSDTTTIDPSIPSSSSNIPDVTVDPSTTSSTELPEVTSNPSVTTSSQTPGRGDIPNPPSPGVNGTTTSNPNGTHEINGTGGGGHDNNNVSSTPFPSCVDPKNCVTSIKPSTEKSPSSDASTEDSNIANKNGTWIANKNGWVGKYANRNRAIIFVFGNSIILCAFFFTIFALIMGKCLFAEASNKQNL